MSTELIKNDEAEFYEAEEVEGTAIDGDSLQEETASPIIVDITYFVDPQGGQSKGNDEGESGTESQEEKGEGEGESENSDQQESQEGENDGENSNQQESQEGEDDDGKTVPYEPGENQDGKSNDGEPQQDGDSSVKTETNAELHDGADVFVQVRTKDRTLVGR